MTEEVTADPIQTLIIDKNVQFPAGYWSEKYLTNTLVSEITKILGYLKNGEVKNLVTFDVCGSGNAV